MVNERFRRGSSAHRRSLLAHYGRRGKRRLGAASGSTGRFVSRSPKFMRRVRNRPSLRRRSGLHAMIRAAVLVGGIGAIAYGAEYVYQRVLTSPALSIQSVRLHQVPSVLIEPVRAKLEPAYGQNLLALDLADLRRSIERLPNVRSATIRRVLPDGLVASVVARQPHARLVAIDASYVIDAEGVVLDTFDPRRTRLPELRLDGGELTANHGQHLTADPVYGDRIRSALFVVDWIARADPTLTRPVHHLRVGDSGIVLVLRPPLLEVVVGDEERLAEKMAAVAGFLRANPPTVPSTIDARYADMLVVRALASGSE